MVSKFVRAATAAAVALSGRVAFACALCADNLSNDVYGKHPTQLGRGFFWSIMLMIAAPFLTVVIVSVKLILARRRARNNPSNLAAACFALRGEAAASVQPRGGIPSTPLSP